MCPQIACLRRGKVTLVAFVWLFSAVYFKMTSQAAFHRGYILTLVALFWFFSPIICVSQGNVYIDPTFTKVMIYNILIHHHQVGNVVPCALPVPNWENEGGGYKKPEQMKVRVIAEDNLKVYKNARSSPLYTGELVGWSLTNGQSWTHSDFNCVALDCYRTSVDHRTWYFLTCFL